MGEVRERPGDRQRGGREHDGVHLREPVLGEGSPYVQTLRGKRFSTGFHSPVHLQRIDVPVVHAVDDELEGIMEISDARGRLGGVHDLLRLGLGNRLDNRLERAAKLVEEQHGIVCNLLERLP